MAARDASQMDTHVSAVVDLAKYCIMFVLYFDLTGIYPAVHGEHALLFVGFVLLLLTLLCAPSSVDPKLPPSDAACPVSFRILRPQAQLSLLQSQLSAATNELSQLQALITSKEEQIDDLKEALQDLAQLEAAQQQAAESAAALAELQQQLEAAQESAQQQVQQLQQQLDAAQGQLAASVSCAA
jgi:septal ring factor EnvC (AmiA/AmiB activator)